MKFILRRGAILHLLVVFAPVIVLFVNKMKKFKFSLPEDFDENEWGFEKKRVFSKLNIND